MKVGLCLPGAEPGTGRRLGANEVIDFGIRAEEMGFDSLWFADHYFVKRGGVVGGSYECWTMMTYLAARTRRAQIGSLVLLNALRHPAMVAKAAAALHELSGGRLVLGVGAGWHPPEYEALGLPFDHRVSRLEESLQVLRALLHGEGIDHAGRFVYAVSPPLVPAAAQPAPPILVAARGERMLRLTARYADAWNMAWLGSDVAPFRQDLQRVRQAEQAAGRPGAVVATAGLWLICHRDPDAARATLANLPGSGLTYSSAEGFVVRDTPPTMPHEVVLGSPEEVLEVLRQYAAAGCQEVLLSLGNRPFVILSNEMLETVASDVLPRARQL